MSLNSPPLNQNETSPQPIETLPDELLLSIFQCLDSLSKALSLCICKKWNETLLLNHSLWTSLILENHLSFEECLSVLRLFNSRSGYKLRHVCLGARVPGEGDLRELFEEVGKSSENLRVLSMVSNFPGDVIMSQAKKSSPKLNTLQLISPGDYHPMAMSHLFSLRQRMGIRDSEDQELKYFRCANLSSGEEEDEDNEDYPSNLKVLGVQGYCSFAALKSMLMASQSTLIDLDLTLWVASHPISTSEEGKLRLKNLQHLELPLFDSALSGLEDIIEVKGKLNRICGYPSGLILFNYPAAKHLALRLSPEEVLLHAEEMEELERTAALFKQYNSIQELTLWCPTERGGQKHLDFILRTQLCNVSKDHSESSLSNEEEEKPDLTERKEASSFNQQEDSQPEISLPNLFKLVIKNPVDLDGNLLWMVFQYRKNVRSDFTIRIQDNEGDVEVTDWEARGWTN